MLVDGELEEWELQGTLQALGQDEELKSRWRDYHLIGDAMRGQLPHPFCCDLGNRVSQALKNEPSYFPPRTVSTSSPNRFTPRKTAVGFALAASLTAIAVVGVMDIARQDRADAAPTIAAAPSTPVTVAAEQSTPRFMYTFTADVSNLPAAIPPAGDRGALNLAGTTGSPRVSTVAVSGGLPLGNDLTDYLMNYQRYDARPEHEDTLSYLRLVGYGE